MFEKKEKGEICALYSWLRPCEGLWTQQMPEFKSSNELNLYSHRGFNSFVVLIVYAVESQTSTLNYEGLKRYSRCTGQ